MRKGRLCGVLGGQRRSGLCACMCFLWAHRPHTCKISATPCDVSESVKNCLLPWLAWFTPGGRFTRGGHRASSVVTRTRPQLGSPSSPGWTTVDMRPQRRLLWAAAAASLCSCAAPASGSSAGTSVQRQDALVEAQTAYVKVRPCLDLTLAGHARARVLASHALDVQQTSQKPCTTCSTPPGGHGRKQHYTRLVWQARKRLPCSRGWVLLAAGAWWLCAGRVSVTACACN